jgi:hypothetical protein
MINLQKVQRLVVATALASGLLATGVAASAQTMAAPVTPAATSVSMTTTDWKAERQAKLDQENADARRAEFYKLGTDF